MSLFVELFAVLFAPACEERILVLRTSSVSTELFLQSIVGKVPNHLILVREVSYTISAIGGGGMSRWTAATMRSPRLGSLGLCHERFFSIAKSSLRLASPT